MFCPCGGYSPTGAIYCIECGKRLSLQQRRLSITSPAALYQTLKLFLTQMTMAREEKRSHQAYTGITELLNRCKVYEGIMYIIGDLDIDLLHEYINQYAGEIEAIFFTSDQYLQFITLRRSLYYRVNVHYTDPYGNFQLDEWYYGIRVFFSPTHYLKYIGEKRV